MKTDEDLSIKMERSLIRWIEEYNREDWVAVTGGVRKGMLMIVVYVDRLVNEDDIEVLADLGGYVYSDFYYGDIDNISEECLSLKKHELEMIDFWVFNKIS
jgi:hypothetical protein